MVPSRSAAALLEPGHHAPEVHDADPARELARLDERLERVDGGGHHHDHRDVGVIAQVRAVRAGSDERVHLLAGLDERARHLQRVLEALVEDAHLGDVGEERRDALEDVSQAARAERPDDGPAVRVDGHVAPPGSGPRLRASRCAPVSEHIRSESGGARNCHSRGLRSPPERFMSRGAWLPRARWAAPARCGCCNTLGSGPQGRATMERIDKVAVLGSGVMGATIAAHLANAGLRVLLLDVVPKEPSAEERAAGLSLRDRAVRDRIATAGRAALGKMKPGPLYLPAYAARIEVGNLEDDLPRLRDCDWVVEVVVENLAVKKDAPRARRAAPRPGRDPLHQHERPLGERARRGAPGGAASAAASSPTSSTRPATCGSSRSSRAASPIRRSRRGWRSFIRAAARQGRSSRRRTPRTSSRTGSASSRSATPSATWWSSASPWRTWTRSPGPPPRARRAPPSAPPTSSASTRSRTWRRTRTSSCPDDEQREVFRLPEFVGRMVAPRAPRQQDEGRLLQEDEGRRRRGDLFLDHRTGEYLPGERSRGSPRSRRRRGSTTRRRGCATVLAGKDPAAELAWRNLRDTLIYAFNRIPEIADDVVNVDDAMRWGFSWELGPFEMLDAIGVAEFVRAGGGGRRARSPPRSGAVERFYAEEGGRRRFLDLAHGGGWQRRAPAGGPPRPRRSSRRPARWWSGTRARPCSTSATACSASSSTPR